MADYEGICRVYMPSADAFSTLVASDTNDFVATKNIYAENIEEYKAKWIRLETIYKYLGI